MTSGFFIDQTIVKAPFVVSIAFQGFTMTQKKLQKMKVATNHDNRRVVLNCVVIAVLVFDLEN